MASVYTREQLKLCIAKMCASIGWHTTMTTPIELLTDILCNYMCQLSKLTNDYANRFGLNEPSVDHLLLAFKDFHVHLHDLNDFVQNVDLPEPSHSVPQYPVPRESNLNFLKPGSKEVVTRQVHVHEHLPPMFPHLEEENANREAAKTEAVEAAASSETTPVFKRPAEVSPDGFKRPRILTDEEAGRPTREISSVIMTTSGFLSPSREGRLPEARAPILALEPSLPMLPPEHSDAVKKPHKSFKKGDKPKDNNGKDNFKPHKDPPSNKHSSHSKNDNRHKKHRGGASSSTNSVPQKSYMVVSESKANPIPPKKPPPPPTHSENDNQMKFNKTLAAARMKTEKFNTTITPIPSTPPPSRSIPATIVRPEQAVDKLFTEPDKKKVNILKKISVKSERSDKNSKVKEPIRVEPRVDSPELVIDEPINAPSSSHHNFSRDITIELVNRPSSSEVAPAKKSPEKSDRFEKYYFDDYSPPGTPSTPRTPEMISHSPPMTKSGKHKQKSKHSKFHKYSSPCGMDMDGVDVELERPKTPDSNLIMRPEKRRPPAAPPSMNFPFFAPFSGPGLIPTPLTNSLFPHMPIPHFGTSPFMPSIHPPMPMNFMPPIATRSPPTSTITKPNVVAVVPPPAPTPRTLTSPVPSSSSVVTSTSTMANEHQPPPSVSTARDTIAPFSLRLDDDNAASTSNSNGRSKEHKKDKKDKFKKKNKKDKHKSDKKKLKEEKKEKSRIKKEKKEKRKKELESGSTSPVPKLTLKLPPKKLNIKAVVKHEEPKEPPREASREQLQEQPRDQSREQPREQSREQPREQSREQPREQSRQQPIEPQPSTSTAPEYVPTREMSPELARFSALVTGQPKHRPHTAVSSTSREEDLSQAGPSRRGRPRIHPIRQRPVAGRSRRRHRSSSEDSDGKKVWICPGCGVQDDGSPMIGCDDCDAWYHWVCVGIQVPPDDNEDWYCRHCIERNRDLLKREKRKKRKGKDRRGRRH